MRAAITRTGAWWPDSGFESVGINFFLLAAEKSGCHATLRLRRRRGDDLGLLLFRLLDFAIASLLAFGHPVLLGLRFQLSDPST
jgi:hypothetical protein